jgi:glycosyltransferase involved in cell wall biosynthesis
VTPHRASVHALRGAAAAGGGPGWATAVAGGLARHLPTRLVVPPGDEVELDPWLVADGVRPTVVEQAPARTRQDDVRRAWADRGDRLTVVQSPHAPRLTASPAGAVLVDFPLGVVEAPLDRWRLGRYRWVVANSPFTAAWVRRRWGRDAQVLPPLVRPPAVLPKEPVIAVVGRFAGGHRSKHQRRLVEAFGRLGPSVHRTWSLHVAGWVDDPAELAAVQDAARGLPVHVHPDAPRAEVEALLGRASMCWHACGFEVDEARHPERLEHFGISVVEAMGAGAAPLVLDRGGPAETVAGVAPTWHGLDDLVHEAQALIASPSTLAGVSERARRRAADFGPDRFQERLDRLFSPALDR